MADTISGVGKNIQFELVSPERILASEEAVMVVIPGGDGDYGVLADHAPVVSTIRPGVVSVHTPSGEVKKIFVSGGFADVTGSLCSILAEEAVNVNDINRAEVEQKIKDWAAELADSGHDDVKKNNLIRAIEIADVKLAAAA